MYQLQVENMSCGHCVNAVTKAVQSVDPQAQVQIELEQKSVKVGTDKSLEAISAAIVEAGYPVTSAA
ncbi:heavy-metal-associated domain-containing protein [Janthinobacterium sp. PC23-8]|uniref:heavy-metal-associated domain-containing protein n=1 Tax=Janthinobacterium sp. PC23-8 TaxID=2012679 RepID=UPI000B973C7C|nr:heavy-metal-associated domain-containing protein [Janthinobacterium sp. PC23-8]OYO32387.1 copper-binding protein [Janthinobacterium sp. PC23-8]